MVNEAQYYLTFKALTLANSLGLMHYPSALKFVQMDAMHITIMAYSEANPNIHV